MASSGSHLVGGGTEGASSQSSISRSATKAKELNDFLTALDAYNPTVPEALTQYYLERSGVDVEDDRIVKLVSLAADKLLTEILDNSLETRGLRQLSLKNSKKKEEMSKNLDIEDVAGGLTQMRVHFRGSRTKQDS
ncbi:hypothetical protein EON65_47475 [archaeon]|nr:MAG: hypothetical protein EON65_47475 [archaeon]